LRELVEAVRRLDYGRPSDRSVDGMLRERRGTCSTKHLYLAAEILRRFPEASRRSSTAFTGSIGSRLVSW
jgi:hypothetical protein